MGRGGGELVVVMWGGVGDLGLGLCGEGRGEGWVQLGYDHRQIIPIPGTNFSHIRT